jgi:hypothetical protein
MRVSAVAPRRKTSAVHPGNAMSGYGTKRTYRDVRYRSAFEGKADISQRLPNNRDL